MGCVHSHCEEGEKVHKPTGMRKVVQLHVLCGKTSHDSPTLSKKRLGTSAINDSYGHKPQHYLSPFHPCFLHFYQFLKLLDG
jgi:hypothetical protein